MIMVDAVAASCVAGGKDQSMFSGQAYPVCVVSGSWCLLLHDPAGLLAFCLHPQLHHK